jgi:hypothetical protein
VLPEPSAARLAPPCSLAPADAPAKCSSRNLDLETLRDHPAAAALFVTCSLRCRALWSHAGNVNSQLASSWSAGRLHAAYQWSDARNLDKFAHYFQRATPEVTIWVHPGPADRKKLLSAHRTQFSVLFQLPTRLLGVLALAHRKKMSVAGLGHGVTRQTRFHARVSGRPEDLVDQIPRVALR